MHKIIYFCLSFVIFLFLSKGNCQQQQKNIFLSNKKNLLTNENDWSYYQKLLIKTQEEDRALGMSYIISGGIALAGGIAGANVTSDPLEKGIYAVFQTIGVASIGYGAYKWKIGDDNRLIIQSINNTPDINDHQKYLLIKSYYEEKKKVEKQEKYIKAVTHGLIAALNFYNASNQKQEGVKNALYFIGTANLLASVSFAF